jgi:uncharacterized protein DUF6745
MKSAADIRAEWLKPLLSTTPADRPRAEAAVRRLYAAAGFSEPRHVVWFDSPFEASWAVALLIAPHHQLWSQRLAPSSLSRDDRARIDRARGALGSALAIADWSSLLAAVGGPMGMHLQFPPVPSRLFQMKFVEARFRLSSDVSSMFFVHGDTDDLNRAEERFIGSNRGALRSALHCPTTDALVGQSFFGDYSFSSMADDEHRVGDREAPAIMRAAWDIAQSSGMWWPFENAAIMSDRPAELHVNDQLLLHREDGPAVTYRDGARVYAWNGKAVPERWIMQPESVPPREYKGFDPTFAKFAQSRAQPTGKSRKRAKPASIVATALSSDPAARLEQLRAHAGGKLPLYDRYQAGAHREVWQELVALGAAVREDAYAADALAVAYETMRRVEANMRTLVQRLANMGYAFGSSSAESGTPQVVMGPGGQRMDLEQLMRQVSGPKTVADSPQLSGLLNMMAKARDLLGSQARAKPDARDATARPHVPPSAGAAKEVASFEKKFGTLPLSLRTFYEVVGEVSLIGSHATLDPKGNRIPPDPLVVYGLDEGLLELDEDDEGETPAAITIAPDDLHKANTSGGEPYAMAIPDLRADGELLNERHHLFFVDYLRLCFRFGGFPGYDGAAEVPKEIATLSQGLIPI